MCSRVSSESPAFLHSLRHSESGEERQPSGGLVGLHSIIFIIHVGFLGVSKHRFTSLSAKDHKTHHMTHPFTHLKEKRSQAKNEREADRLRLKMMVFQREIIEEVLVFMGRGQHRSHHDHASPVSLIFHESQGFIFGSGLQESQWFLVHIILYI